MAKAPKKNHVKSLDKKLKSIKAEDIMTKEVINTTKDAPLSEIAEIMIRKRISGLPVVDKKGKAIGVITANDLFTVLDMIKSGDFYVSEAEGLESPNVKFAMSSEVVKIKKETTLDEIVSLMQSKNAHTLPVYSGTKMVGIVGRRDVFKNFYEAVKK